jgi:hypothetical protein
MWLLSVKKSTKPDKKYTAVFCKCKIKNECKGSNHKVVSFGSKGSETFLDHKDEKKKSAYIARHSKGENWNDPTSAGALSKYLLWNLPTLAQSIAYFKKKFKL